jgi:hypothetical protein
MDTQTENDFDRPPAIQRYDSKGEKKEKLDTPNEKIEVDPRAIEKTQYSEIIKPKVWEGIKRLEHCMLVGATSAGKTYFFKQLLADEKIPMFDMYITVGNLSASNKDKIASSDELQIGYAANYDLNNMNYRNIDSRFFTMQDYEAAINLCMSGETIETSKLIFFNDALIQTPKMTQNIAYLLHQAKNFNTTCVVEAHDYFSQNIKLARNACPVQIFFKLSPRELAKALKEELKSPIIKTYESKDVKERVLIHDVANNLYYNKQYFTF